MYTLEEFIKEKNGLEYQVKIVLDEDPMLDWLGEYTDKQPEKYYIDRKEGLLIGKSDWDYIVFPESEFNDDSEESDFVASISKKLELPIPELNFDIELTDYYQQDDNTWIAEFEYKEILANVTNGSYGRNSYRYYVSYNHLKPDIAQEEIDKWTLEEMIKWTIGDYERLEDYNKNHWCMTGVIVSLNDIEESLWGVESDASKEDLQEIIDGLIYQVNQSIPKEVTSLRERANHLESLLINLD